MHRILRGVERFQTEAFEPHRELFERLSSGQSPETLFITCSDSRIQPSLLTQARPGELFVIRNAGNLVPAYGRSGGEAATVEYAVAVLKVRDVVVCGHSDCGAVKALLAPPDTLGELPAVREWLTLAESTRRVVQRLRESADPADLLRLAIEANVRAQLDNLATHPSVASALRLGELRLHGWTWCIGTGTIRALDPTSGEFQPLAFPEAVAR